MKRTNERQRGRDERDAEVAALKEERDALARRVAELESEDFFSWCTPEERAVLDAMRGPPDPERMHGPPREWFEYWSKRGGYWKPVADAMLALLARRAAKGGGK